MATSRAKLFELAHPDLSISEQYLALVTSGQGESHITDHDRTVVWQGVLKPLAFSRRYSVTVRYTKGRSPSCIVTNPSLEELANGKSIPHTYTNKTKYKGTQLCLYLPYIAGKNKVSEWSPKLSLVEQLFLGLLYGWFTLKIGWHAENGVAGVLNMILRIVIDEK